MCIVYRVYSVSLYVYEPYIGLKYLFLQGKVRVSAGLSRGQYNYNGITRRSYGG